MNVHYYSAAIRSATISLLQSTANGRRFGTAQSFILLVTYGPSNDFANTEVCSECRFDVTQLRISKTFDLYLWSFQTSQQWKLCGQKFVHSVSIPDMWLNAWYTRTPIHPHITIVQAKPVQSPTPLPHNYNHSPPSHHQTPTQLDQQFNHPLLYPLRFTQIPTPIAHPRLPACVPQISILLLPQSPKIVPFWPASPTIMYPQLISPFHHPCTRSRHTIFRSKSPNPHSRPHLSTHHPTDVCTDH